MSFRIEYWNGDTDRVTASTIEEATEVALRAFSSVEDLTVMMYPDMAVVIDPPRYGGGPDLVLTPGPPRAWQQNLGI